MDETSVVSTETPTAVLARWFSIVGQARPPQEYRIKEIRDDSLFTGNDVFNHVHAETMRRDCLELVVGDRTALGSTGAIDIEFDHHRFCRNNSTRQRQPAGQEFFTMSVKSDQSSTLNTRTDCLNQLIAERRLIAL